MSPKLGVAVLLTIISIAAAQCPFGHGSAAQESAHVRRDGYGRPTDGSHSFAPHIVNDTPDDYLTSDVGGPIEDQGSLKAGDRGPTLLEDFIFRQKITHFDHERVRRIL
jgi:catalase